MSARRSRSVAIVALVLGLGLAGCADDADDADDGNDTPSETPAVTAPGGATVPGAGSDPPGDLSDVSFRAVPVGTFDIPIVLLPRPGDDHLWLAERAGTIRRLRQEADGSLEAEGDPVLDLTGQTDIGGERGLLGLAFSADGGTVYVSHTDPEGHSRVASYAVSEDSDGEVAIDPATRAELLLVEQPYPNHNGGHLVRGPDDALWFGLGDGGAADDPLNHGQTDDSLLATLVRIDLSGQEDHEVVVTGVRNPWRFDFDANGGLWIADVGQSAVEEINHLPAGAIDGANLGWSGFEGSRPHLDGDGRRPDDPVMPVFEYGHDRGCSVTGGVVYQGSAIAELAGAYLYSDYCGGWIHALVPDRAGVSDHDLGLEVETPISFGTDAEGEVFVLSAAGPVLRLEAG